MADQRVDLFYEPAHDIHQLGRAFGNPAWPTSPSFSVRATPMSGRLMTSTVGTQTNAPVTTQGRERQGKKICAGQANVAGPLAGH
jgi:hypothetical protein